MSKYRQIKSVAHNFSHSFTSMMNWYDGDYMMDRLISIMSRNKIDEIKLDILSTRLEPESINIKEVAYSIKIYCDQFFPGLLKSHGIPANYIKQAILTLRFHFSEIRHYERMCNSIIVPYDCRTEIIDNRGRVYVGEIHNGEATSYKRIFD